MTDYHQEAERVWELVRMGAEGAAWPDYNGPTVIESISAALRAAYREGVEAMRDAIVDYWDVRDNSAVEAIADRLLKEKP